MKCDCICEPHERCDCPAGITKLSEQAATQPVTSILRDADELVRGDRASEHGVFAHNAIDASLAFAAITGRTIHAEDIPAVMMCLKLARARQNPTNRDNWVDAAGYLYLWGEMLGVDE